MDRLRELVGLQERWRQVPAGSRASVEAELRELGEGWTRSAYDDETRQDAATILLVVELLKALDEETG